MLKHSISFIKNISIFSTKQFMDLIFKEFQSPPGMFIFKQGRLISFETKIQYSIQLIDLLSREHFDGI